MPYDEDYEDAVIDDEGELTLLDLFGILWRGKFFVLFVTVFFGLAAYIYTFFMDTTYRAVCKVLTQQVGGVSGVSLGGLAELIGIPTRTTGSSMFIALMKTDAVLDTVIDGLNMMEGQSPDMRYALRGQIAGSVKAELDKDSSGILLIECINTSSDDTAPIANAFVDAVKVRMQEIAVEDAQQKKKFFEDQLMQAQQELYAAEDAMLNYQQSAGLIAFETQTQSLLSSIASLRNQIAAKNVEISSLRSYAREDNPRLRLAQSQLDAMTKELRRLEEQSRLGDTGMRGSVSGDLLSSVGQIPELGIEYQRYARALRFATVKYESMFRQYEGAKLSEVNDLSNISILEKAVPPRGAYGPNSRRIITLASAGGFIISVFMIFVAAHIRALLKAQKEREY